MMMPTNGSLSGRPGSGRGIVQSVKPSIKPSIKKKPAPPRPPQPKINRLQTSMSFNTAQDLAAPPGTRATTGGIISGKIDLIDFSTPPGSPNSGRRNTVSNISTALKDPNEFSYRVGASIFYVKSPLKHSTSETPVQNPFSPPRPAANLQSNLNAAWNSPVKQQPVKWQQPPAAVNQLSAWDAPPRNNTNNFYSANASASKPPNFVATSSSAVVNSISSPDNNNTIKSHYQNNQASAWTPVRGHQSSSSTTSSDRNSATSYTDFNQSSSLQQQQQPPRYGNVPVDALKKELSATLSSGGVVGSKKPTIIRPANKVTITQSSSTTAAAVEGGGALASSYAQFSSRALMNSIKSEEKSTSDSKVENETPRNYYDVPPDEDDDFDDDDDDEANDSSLTASPPMPSEPPPPPPPDVAAVDEWVNSTTGVADYPDTYSDAGQGTAYAITLYDFFPEAQGDLQLQAGDLVYLTRKIDDSWYQGSCGGMEGIFPSSFVNVVVALPEDSNESQHNNAQSDSGGILLADVLYDFAAETEGDLGLQAGEKILVLGRINEDWLYGEKEGSKGQFPAAFVQEILQDLPIITI